MAPPPLSTGLEMLEFRVPEFRYKGGQTILPQLAQDRRLLDAFTFTVRNGERNGLADWLDQAKASRLAALSHGLSADLDAVLAALREPWPNGQIEGQINRLKLLKRQMYGAAGIDLLLARLQH